MVLCAKYLAYKLDRNLARRIADVKLSSTWADRFSKGTSWGILLSKNNRQPRSQLGHFANRASFMQDESSTDGGRHASVRSIIDSVAGKYF